MKIISLFLVVVLTACSAQSSISKPESNSFILDNVNIVDVKNQIILPSKSLLISDGKIVRISNAESLPGDSNIRIINGKGGYVTPGLIDMHVHMYEEAAYIFTLSHGVTHVRIMNGVQQQLTWRDKVNEGTQIGSSSSVSSPIISGYIDAPLHHGVETAEQARNAVRKYYSAGYDLIKAYGNLNDEALSALIAESNNLGMPIAKHGPNTSGDLPISELNGIQSFEHVEDIYQGQLNYEFTPERLPNILTELKATGVPITPTLNIFYQLTKLSVEKEDYLTSSATEYTSDIIALEATKNEVDRWLQASDKMAAHNKKTLKFLKDITLALHKQDIPLLVGSDSGVLLSPHGLATHNEMQLLNSSGINAFDVLTAATINPAKALNLDKKMGQIAINFDADFIYTHTNPVQDLSVLKDPIAVAKNGYWYSSSDLKTLREEAIESRSFWAELTLLLEAL